MTKYSKILPLLKELHTRENESIGYDPIGYTEDRTKQEIQRIEEELDDEFGKIIHILTGGQIIERGI